MLVLEPTNRQGLRTSEDALIAKVERSEFCARNGSSKGAGGRRGHLGNDCSLHRLPVI